MGSSNDRRDFLKHGAAATAGLFAASATMAKAAESADTGNSRAEGEAFPRMHPGLGGPIGSPTDRGKLVPGLREAGQAPVNVIAPDLKTTWGKIVNGAREFHLHAMPVRREVLPGIWMDAYGFNGQFPGPVLEMYQGERIRIVFRNDLPEPTTLHSHGLELPISFDGIPAVTQDLVKPGHTFVYEYDVHQEGSYFLHPHVAMQEAIGMVVPFIIHPKVAYEPTVDRDFVLMTQQFAMLPNAHIPNTMSMDWNFLTINGRCGPYTTPLVCKLGERIRIRFLNFSTLHQHPMHLHGHTFWVTGTEGGRIPEPAWIPGNTVIVGVAQSRDVELIANNPGDWVLHCHMFHHMMNHMVSQVGPIIRQKKDDPGFKVPGYPQMMKGMSDMKVLPEGEELPFDDYSMPMTTEDMRKINGRREVQGMREGWFKGVKGLFTVMRVLPPHLYDKVMNTDEPIPPNSSTPLNPPPGSQKL
ncbi:MAG: copper oxidase [Gimesia sp.]|uniref:Copper oxidase n=1 Tax=Gimesia maris TaxID=122 RepID=A0A3D3R8X8_9PLAN|nr:copper oxidase [Gimesia sp.]HCO25036.1 copper oxidase [Gimesia maris]